MSFETLGLNEALTKAVAASGYDTTTEVQTQAIPPALAGTDLMVSASTGSGKTALRWRCRSRKLQPLWSGLHSGPMFRNSWSSDLTYTAPPHATCGGRTNKAPAGTSWCRQKSRWGEGPNQRHELGLDLGNSQSDGIAANHSRKHESSRCSNKPHVAPNALLVGRLDEVRGDERNAAAKNCGEVGILCRIESSHEKRIWRDVRLVRTP